MTVFGFIEELKAQWHLIVPSVFIYWTSILLWTVTFFVLGRLGEYALAGASLGLSVMNLVGNVMTVGMVSGLSILFTQVRKDGKSGEGWNVIRREGGAGGNASSSLLETAHGVGRFDCPKFFLCLFGLV